MPNNLFPVFDVPSALAEDVQQQQSQPQYLPAPLFDIESGEFILAFKGQGYRQLTYGSAYDAWVLWCTKTVLTQRWAYQAYSSNAGIELEQALAQTDRQAAASTFRRTITEALLADPAGRTRQVRDFAFSWGSDSLNITCTAVGQDGNSAAIKAALKI